MSPRPLGDDVLVRTAARQVAVRTAALVALAMLLLVGLVTLVVVRGQAGAADGLLRTAAATADDVGDPPRGSWLALTRGARTMASPGLPAEVLPALAALRGPASRRVTLSHLRTGDATDYRVATQQRGGTVVQVVLDLHEQDAERTRLLTAMVGAAALALAFAAALGVLVGRRAVRPLADALSLQRTFVADASHELRTPLTLLSTRAQLLDLAVQRGDRTAQVGQDSAGVVGDVHRLGEVLEDLLLAADPRRQDPTEPVDVRSLVTAAVDSAVAHAEQAGVQLTAAPSGSEPIRVLGAAPALRRALLALVDNAIDHTPAGGQVTVATRQGRREVTVSVSDTGPGVPPDVAHEVLRRFHSGGQRSGRAHYGLGLALSHDVANRHGGHLRLVQGGVGATFDLTLPTLPALD